MSTLVSIERRIVRKFGGQEIVVNTTNCPWCADRPYVCAVCVAKADKAEITMKNDLERAIAVIADLCGAGRPAVKESAEELAEWAEEFTDRYFAKQEPFVNNNHARTCALYHDKLLQGINSACGCGGLAKDRNAQ